MKTRPQLIFLILAGAVMGILFIPAVARIDVGNHMPLGLGVLNILLFVAVLLLPVIVVLTPLLAIVFILTLSSRSSGNEDTKNFADAFKQMHKAAKQGDAFSQFEIGTMYEQGKGVERDYAEAYFWLSLSGNPLNRGNEVKVHLSADQLAEAERRIESWKRAHPDPDSK
jgi:hypothetical protein